MQTSLERIVYKIFNIDARYFLRGGIWLTLSQVFVIVGGLITTALFAHFLSPTSYGTYRYLIGLAVLLSSFSLTGLGQAILQASAQGYSRFFQETFKINLIYSSGTSLLAVIGMLYYSWQGNQTLALGCLLIAVIQPLVTIFQYVPSYLQGSQQFKTATTLSFFRTVTITTIALATVFVTKNILLLLLSYLLSYFVTGWLSYIWIRPTSDPTPAPMQEKYLKFAKHVSVQNIIASVSQRLDTVLVFTQLGAAELAVYSIAIVVPEQIKASFKNLAALLIPKYAQNKNNMLLRASMPRRSVQLFLILISITCGYVLVAPYLYTILFPNYQNAIFYSQITALAFPAFVMLIPYSYLQSRLSQEILYKITIYTSIIQIAVLSFCILNFGLVGAIIAKLVYRICYSLIVYYYFFTH